ncbi:uncharacterized protein LOC144423012 [Styela clava]
MSDEDGIVSELRMKKKRSRAGYESHFTKLLKTIEDLMLDPQKYKEVVGAKEAVDAAFENCINACEDFRNSVNTGLEMDKLEFEEATVKCDEIFRKKAVCDKLYGEYLQRYNAAASKNNSVSSKSRKTSVASHRSKSSNKSSVRSSVAARARLDAKLADLQAKREREQATLEKEKLNIEKRALDAEYLADEAKLIAESFEETEGSIMSSNLDSNQLEYTSCASENLVSGIEPLTKPKFVNIYDPKSNVPFVKTEPSSFELQPIPERKIENIPISSPAVVSPVKTNFSDVRVPLMTSTLTNAINMSNPGLQRSSEVPVTSFVQSGHCVYNPVMSGMPVSSYAPATGGVSVASQFPVTSGVSGMGEYHRVSSVPVQNVYGSSVAVTSLSSPAIPVYPVVPTCPASMGEHLKVDLPEFDGDPLRYPEFLSEFTAAVDVENIPANRKLIILLKCTKGIAREAIRSCVITKPWERGYKRALDILNERFGKKHMIIDSFMKELIEGKPLRDNNSADLHKLVTLMDNCEIVFDQWDCMDNLNNSVNLKKIFSRLPEDLQSGYAKIASGIYEVGREPMFSDLKDYVMQIARGASTMYGEIVCSNREQKKSRSPKRGTVPKTRDRVSSFVTDSNAIPSRGAIAKFDCPFCGSGNQHPLWKCLKFKKMTPKERSLWVGRNELCYNCLLSGHKANECTRNVLCNVDGCGKKHNVLLHFPPRQKPGGSTNPVSSCSGKETSAPVSGAGEKATCGATSCSVEATGGVGNVRLKVLPVTVRGKAIGGREISTYALLDPGSTVSLCTSGLMRELGISRVKTNFSVQTVTGHKIQEGFEVALTATGAGNSLVLDRVLTVERLPNLKSSIPSVRDTELYSHFSHVDISDNTDREVKLLIGSNVPDAHDVLEVKRGKRGQPRAVKTLLGWTLFGPESVSNCDNNFVNFIHCDDNILHRQLCQIYEHDFNDNACESASSLSVENKRALSIMEKTVCKVNGHYEVGLPWKNKEVKLPNNRTMVEKQLMYQRRKFIRDPELFECYKSVINDYLDNGYARKIPNDELVTSDKTFYLGHHSTKQSKFRVVFNGAGTSRGVSLNDNLLQGPDYANNLAGVLLRFRQERIGVMADIKAMFHQVRVRPEDCDSLRFLWWPNDDLSSQASDYSMLVHIFGSRSSPSVAGFALRKCASDNEPGVEQSVVDTVLKNFYVDDLLKSLAKSGDAINLVKQLSVLLESGGFHLTKFISNCREVLEQIPESERAKTLVNLDLDNLPVERALGLYWDTDLDKFVTKVNVKDKPTTRRGMLSTMSQIFDPIGFLQPFILPMKKILQKLCKQDLGWDDEIPDGEKACWMNWLQDLPHLESVSIPRCLKSSDMNDPSEIQMHIFCDASETGYGCACYMRMLNKSDGTVHCSFVMGKSRVTPSKPVTIPRLELTAAVVAVKLGQFVKTQLEYKIDRVIYWTDSMSVLQYITNTTRRFHTFVANRLAVIHEGSEPSQWRHIDTKCNPADIASRGLKPYQLDKAKIWFEGPVFLMREESLWPKSKPIRGILNNDPELKQDLSVYCVRDNLKENPIKHLLSRYSTLEKLQRSTAWLLRYRSYLRWKVAKSRGDGDVGQLKTGHFEICELHCAIDCIVRFVQREQFGKQIDALHNHSSLEEKIVRTPKKSLSRNEQMRSIQKLNPIVVDGILRVGGRLDRSHLPLESRYPVILPSDSYVTNLVIDMYHEREGHSGTLHVLSAIREKFWIIKGHATVRRRLSKCFTCCRWNSKVGEQVMAPLPKVRVTPSDHAFMETACDYFGPILVKRGRSEEKRYGCMFSCMATRAVHIEIAKSLDTSSFINVFQRFINRRGRPRKMYSDNGTNFIGAERELREGIQNWNQNQISKVMQQQNIEWCFSVPLASHTNGAWERMIRSFRKLMRAIAGERLLDDDALHTFTTQCESILNGRPICPIGDSPDDLATLSPNMLLLGRPNPNLPPDQFMKADGYKKSWRQVQLMTDCFWKRWLKEYLPTLQLRQKWHKPVRNFAIGDIVLIVDEKTKRGFWPKGLIEEVFPDSDGHVRSVRVRTADSCYMRDIRKLCLLEGVV